MKSLSFGSTVPPIRSSPFLYLSRTSLNRFTLKIPTRCGFSSSHGGISRASISVLAGNSLNNLKMQVGSPIPLQSINPMAKLSLSDQAFLLLAFIACTVQELPSTILLIHVIDALAFFYLLMVGPLLQTSVAFTSLVIAAIPTLVAMGRAATSFAKLADTARKELPSTLAAIRLSGMEISDLTLELSDLSQDIADGVNKSAKAVQAAEAGIKQIGALAQQQTISMIEERASLPEISLQPVVAGVAEKTSHAIGSATKKLMNIITGGDKDDDYLGV